MKLIYSTGKEKINLNEPDSRKTEGIKKINLFFIVIPACPHSGGLAEESRESFFLLQERFCTSQNDRIR